MGMNTITFGKEKYHLHQRMENWCTSHFGPGNWIGAYSPESWEGMQVNWTINSMFGNTTFCFKNEEDYTWFVMQWA
jgi:hypothetical protein